MCAAFQTPVSAKVTIHFVKDPVFLTTWQCFNSTADSVRGFGVFLMTSCTLSLLAKLCAQELGQYIKIGPGIAHEIHVQSNHIIKKSKRIGEWIDID